ARPAVQGEELQVVSPECGYRRTASKPQNPCATLETRARLRQHGRMKSLFLSSLSLLMWASASAAPLRDGDIIFHTSRSAQSVAIQRATHSPYSHVGLIFIRDGKPYVFEAISTVRYTPLAKWTA